MGKDLSLVNEINLHDLPEMRGMPLNISMICNRLNQEMQTKFVSFKDSISKVANNYM